MSDTERITALEARVAELEDAVRFMGRNLVDSVRSENFNGRLGIQVLANEGFPLRVYLPPGRRA